MFGALWGAVEMTLGAFLSATRVPLAGVLMALFGVCLMTASQALVGRSWFVLRAALICAGLRSVTPGGFIINPLIAIALQGLIMSLAFRILRRPLLAGVVAGGLVAVASVSQGIIVKLIVYGATLLELYQEFVFRLEHWLGFQTGSHWWLIMTALAVVASLGALAGVVGWYLGRAAAKERGLA